MRSCCARCLEFKGRCKAGMIVPLWSSTVQWGQRDGKNPCSKHIHSAEYAECWEGNKRVFNRDGRWVAGFGVCCQETLTHFRDATFQGCHISGMPHFSQALQDRGNLVRGKQWEVCSTRGPQHAQRPGGGGSQDGKKRLWGSMTWTGESFTRWDWSGGQGVKGWGRNFGLIIIFLLPHCGLWGKVEPRPMAVEVPSPNHGTAGEFPGLNCYWRVLGGWVIWTGFESQNITVAVGWKFSSCSI